MGTIGKITAGGSTHLIASTAYGTCNTAAGTVAKVATIQDSQAFTLYAGVTVHIKMTNTNTAANPTLNVNSTGAKPIMCYGTTAAGTNANTSWFAGALVAFTYDGTNWMINDYSHRGNDNTVPSAYSTTAADNAAKVATFTNYNLLANSYFNLVISTTNSAASRLTLNVNGKGAKDLYINGTVSSSSNHTLPAGTYVVFYDGTLYYVRTDGLIPKYEPFTGATASANGVRGIVPAPAKANVNHFLKGNGTWADPSDNWSISNITLTASSWTSSGEYTVSNSLITASSVQFLMPRMGITAAQLKAYQTANIVASAQAAGSITLKAYGKVPAINIPVTIIYT